MEPHQEGLVHRKTEPTDRDVFFASLALFDRDDGERTVGVLPHDVDVDVAVDAAFARVQRNPTLLPL
jgi:hypothetical protein